MTTTETIPRSLQAHLVQALQAQGGWLSFDAFMAQALYTPGLGYYAHGSTKFGLMPQVMVKGVADAGPEAGSDFVTAPELSPLFGQALAVQLAQALAQTQTSELWEFGAGSGALAEQVLDALQAQGQPLTRYTIVDLSGSLRARQQTRLAKYGELVHWATELPERMQGVVLGNEVLDAMPVKLLARVAGQWYERGVALGADGVNWVWQDRPTALRPPVEIEGAYDYLTEIHPQAEAFIRTLADRLRQGAAFFIDYGFPEAEYYHPQRHMGTVMCHQAHRADADPLRDVGHKDITAHVNFTGIALAAQDAGLGVLGYCNQGRFLFNCGLATLLDSASLPQRAMAQHLVMEHEMGELFKVIGLFKADNGQPWQALGFAQGDKTHRL